MRGRGWEMDCGVGVFFGGYMIIETPKHQCRLPEHTSRTMGVWSFGWSAATNGRNCSHKSSLPQ